MIKERNYSKREGGARLAAIRVDNIDDSLEVLIIYFILVFVIFIFILFVVVWKLYSKWRYSYYFNAK
jgi:uncharacterized membrane protein YdbT with pleckstrin-like domain